jgi:hypothetical protein
MTRAQLAGAQHDADQAATVPTGEKRLATAGTSIRLLSRDRIWGGGLASVPVPELGFLIAVRDVVYVHVSTTEDGVWEFAPLDP